MRLHLAGPAGGSGTRRGAHRGCERRAWHPRRSRGRRRSLSLGRLLPASVEPCERRLSAPQGLPRVLHRGAKSLTLSLPGRSRGRRRTLPLSGTFGLASSPRCIPAPGALLHARITLSLPSGGTFGLDLLTAGDLRSTLTLSRRVRLGMLERDDLRTRHPRVDEPPEGKVTGVAADEVSTCERSRAVRRAAPAVVASLRPMREPVDEKIESAHDAALVRRSRRRSRSESPPQMPNRSSWSSA
jgi:hypothetical protein